MKKAYFISFIIAIALLFQNSACRKGPPTGTSIQEIELIDSIFVFEGGGKVTESMELSAGDTLTIEAALINGNIIQYMRVVDEEEHVVYSIFLFTSGVFNVPIYSSKKYYFTIVADSGMGPTKLYVMLKYWRWE